jgi:hypothetical protein
MRISSSFHRNVTCSRHGIAEKIAHLVLIHNQQKMTEQGCYSSFFMNESYNKKLFIL